MRVSRYCVLLSCLFLAFSSSTFAQTSSSESPQAASLLQQSLAAQTAGAVVTDLTLTGTVTFIHGTQTESGPMTLTALAAGTTQVVFELPSGTRTEIWSNSGGSPTISGTGPKGSSTQPAGGSVAMPSAAWFSPAVLTNLLSGAAYTSSYVGQETRNGANVQHISVSQTPSPSSAVPAFISNPQTQSDIYLNPSSALPVSMVFPVRPQPQPGKPLSIRARPAPEEVRFLNYQNVQGRMIPLHIQLFLGLPPSQQQIMDLTISSAALNTGATITVPAAAAN
jgi:hypothetical protein